MQDLRYLTEVIEGSLTASPSLESPQDERRRPNPAKSKGTASLKLDNDPLESPHTTETFRGFVPAPVVAP